MACSKEINTNNNLLGECLSDSDELIVMRIDETGDQLRHIKRITWGQLKSCSSVPGIFFTVDDPANEDVPDKITYPLGGGTILFLSALIGRKAVIIHVNNLPLPQREVQPDYFTPNFTSGEITRPDTFKPGDYVEVFIL